MISPKKAALEALARLDRDHLYGRRINESEIFADLKTVRDALEGMREPTGEPVYQVRLAKGGAGMTWENAEFIKEGLLCKI